MIYHITPSPEDMSSGHVPNYIVPLWFEKARTPLREHATSLGAPDTTFGIVRNTSYDYRREVLGGQVTIKTRIKSVGNSSAVCYQEAWQYGELAIVVEAVLVLVHTQERGKLTLPAASREYLLSCRESPNE